MKARFLFCTYLLTVAMATSPYNIAKTASASSSIEPRPTVIELFTSQGCSSCPPADALLGELANNANIIALAFHVDYWDYIGWHDPFALTQSTQRQNGYAHSLKLSTVFTPQAFIDGRNSIVGSNRSAMKKAINIQQTGVSFGMNIDNNILSISLGERDDHDPLDIMLIAYQENASTLVRRGENSGRILREFNIVRDFRRIDIWDGKARKLEVPISSLPTDANRVAVLVQQKDQGQIVGGKQIVIR